MIISDLHTYSGRAALPRRPRMEGGAAALPRAREGKNPVPHPGENWRRSQTAATVQKHGFTRANPDIS